MGDRAKSWLPVAGVLAPALVVDAFFAWQLGRVASFCDGSGQVGVQRFVLVVFCAPMSVAALAYAWSRQRRWTVMARLAFSAVVVAAFAWPQLVVSAVPLTGCS